MRRKFLHALVGVSLVAALVAAPQATVGAQGWAGFTTLEAPSAIGGGAPTSNTSPAWTAAITRDLGGAAMDVWVNNHAVRSEGLEDYVGGGSVFTDATLSPLALADTHGAVFTDVDGDGDEDLVETMGRDNQNRIFRNDAGTLNLLATPTGIEDVRGRTRQALMVDIEGDGDMDMFVVNLDRTVLSCDDGDSDEDPTTPECNDHDLTADPPVGVADAAAPSELYLNNGTGTSWSKVADPGEVMTDVGARYLHLTSTGPATPQVVLTSDVFGFALDSIATGTATLTTAANEVNTLAFAANNVTHVRDFALGDLDGDLAPEVVAARQDDFLSTDDSPADGTPDLLGELAIGVGQVSTSALAPRNLTDVSADARVDNCRAITLADFDNDADLDIFAGCTMRQKVAAGVANVNVILLNDGAGNFTIDDASVPEPTTETATIAVAGDFNNDGWVDTYLGTGHDSEEGPDYIFLNGGGTANHWLQIDLVDAGSPDVAGAQVFVGTDKWQVRETGHRLHQGQDMKTLHFGLGSEGFIAPVEIMWPDGTFSSCVIEGGVDQRVTITKGQATCGVQTQSGLLAALATTPDRSPPPMCDGQIVTVEIGEGEAPTEGDDVILGTAGADTINALGGNDLICALGGNDIISGGNGNDTVMGDAGDDSIDGGAGDDTIMGGDGADDLTGFTGRDTLRGEAGDDTIDGGDDNDRIFGGDDNDTLRGGLGRDVLQGGNGNDDIDGGKRNDRISGNGGKDTLFGGNGKDRIDGQAGADIIIGGGGNDRLLGGGGIDTINGKVGDDFCVEGETVLNCEFDFIP